MKYRTVIEVVTDADNKNEAIEIVGEYLSGNIVSGIDMTYATRPVLNHTKAIVAVTVVALFLGVGLFSITQLKPAHKGIPDIAAVNAVQPPLKTSIVQANNGEFKKEWEKKKAAEVLNYIKHVK